MSALLSVTLIGGPTALLELGGVRLLTDPTFDAPRSYEPRPGVYLTKTAGPALTPAQLASVDVVLLSHDHHKDNLDDSGREFLSRAGLVMTTVSGAERLAGMATPLANWQTCQIDRGDGGGALIITGLPAQHGPDGSEPLVGEVTGFLLSGEGLPRVYVSGDNASLDVVAAIADRVGPVDVAVLFVGGAQMPYLGEEYLTLPSVKAPEAARLLGAQAVIAVHLDGWAHFSDDRESLARAFELAGMSHLLMAGVPGDTVTFPGAARLDSSGSYR
jgi:L-ascorbate metabolism protein UlaG (beta-lactamase superfamily)